jgi:chaperonin GroES
VLQPQNDFILVKPVVDEKSEGGIILVAGEKSQRPDKGKVLAVGPGKYVDGVLEPMRTKVGQTVLFQQFPFFEFTDNGHRVVFVRELQVVAVVS